MTSALRFPEAAPAGDCSSLRVNLSCLIVRDCRNIARADLEVSPDGLALVGENGQGKTNLLEAIAYLSLLRSMRGVRDRHLLRFGTPAFHLMAEAEHARARRVGVGVDRTGRKTVSLDGVETVRVSDGLGAIPSVCFSPADIALVAGSPAERRRFLDTVLALSSRRYLSALREYRAALARRNAALRHRPRRAGHVSAIAAWEPALAQHGAVLLEERRDWVTGTAPLFSTMCALIGESEPMHMAYHSQIVKPDAPSDVHTMLVEALARSRELDTQRGFTHVGPHRDDLSLALSDRELRLFGSAGQQRTAAIALRLLEATTLRERTRAQPLLLLDDPLAELDRHRCSRLLALLNEISGAGLAQTIVCVPREEEVPAAFSRLPRCRMRAGVVSKI